jgi:hypothetical protein
VTCPCPADKGWPSANFNKPQSPPALIIPNQQHSPSPVLPPIVTSTEVTAPSQNQQQQAGVGLGIGPSALGAIGLIPAIPVKPSKAGLAGGNRPPDPRPRPTPACCCWFWLGAVTSVDVTTNPALEGLTGMAGISPIAPSADGPMIYIQPSTPISGLKDGRGVFDFKRFTQGQGQQGGQQSHEVLCSPFLSGEAWERLTRVSGRLCMCELVQRFDRRMSGDGTHWVHDLGQSPIRKWASAGWRCTIAR